MEKSLAASLRVRDVRVHRELMPAEAAPFRKLTQTRYGLDAGARAGVP